MEAKRRGAGRGAGEELWAGKRAKATGATQNNSATQLSFSLRATVLMS
jgi:hypothetical protein